MSVHAFFVRCVWLRVEKASQTLPTNCAELSFNDDATKKACTVSNDGCTPFVYGALSPFKAHKRIFYRTTRLPPAYFLHKKTSAPSAVRDSSPSAIHSSGRAESPVTGGFGAPGLKSLGESTSISV